MRISSVVLENIKKFNPKPAIFEFGGQPGVYTLSGGNGSGKTAIFRSVQVFQKIFFFAQLDPEKDTEHSILYEKIWRDLDGLMSADSSLIDIAFKDEEYGFRVELRLEKNHRHWNFIFKPGADGDMEFLNKYWNIDNPTGIVAFIDASKSFSDFGVEFDDIKLSPRRERRRRFMLDCVFEPEKTLQSIYRKAVIDHVQYRIDPKRTYQYFKEANLAVKEISGNIEVANISATKMDGQLVIVGRTSKGAPLFDVKDFSSGERALYLTLLFLFYLPNIGILIIDEPENHLHESLLCQFYDFLEGFLKNNADELYQKVNKSDQSETGNSKINTNVLEQIFLTTHSRALIYKNMDQGFSFAMAGDRILPIEASEVERGLRASGISTVYSRTLFVEGTTDVSLMAEFLERERIKVTAVNNCKEVISYFEKISAIRTTVHGAAFCFAIDADNRTAKEIEAIRKICPEFYDQSFCVLDRHEVENLFIDETLIFDVVNKIRDGLELRPVNSDKIHEIMATEAAKLKSISKQKYLASGLRMELKQIVIDPITDVKVMKKSSIDDLISKTISASLCDTIINSAKELESTFDTLWLKDWKNYVDGKSFIGMLCARLSTECAGANASAIREMMVRRVKENPDSYAFGKFYRDILNKFEKQGAL
jgi:hypothetical protein